MLSVTRLDTEQWNQLLQRFHSLRPQANFQFKTIQGMLRGFIDLIGCFNGQYYLIDYKSNFLGTGYQAYVPARLNEVMLANQYDLQYLIYTVALHRYLKQRDKNYDYQRDFAGVFYLFLRGMNGKDAQSGVFFDKPAFDLINKLDQLLAGE